MSEQNVPSPYILLRQQMGERKPESEGERPFNIFISRGEILLEIPPKEQIPRDDNKPAHNYRVYHDPDVTMYDNGANTSPLHGAEVDYLEAIERQSVRAQEYLHAERLAWIMDLIFGDEVYFSLENKENIPLMILGKIRYFGRTPNYRGVMFGIEIMDKEHRGKGTTDGSPYFHCGDRNGVYVSMEKIIKKKNVSGKNEEKMIGDNDKKHEEKPRPGPAQNTRSKSDKQIGKRSKKKDGGRGFFEIARAIFTGPPTVQPDSTSDVDSQFSPNDRVAVHTVRDKNIYGTVRWVGPVKPSKEDGGIVVPVVGIETDKKIDVDKEFPDLHMNVTGSHGHPLFPVTPNHSRVYLPEQLVLHIDEYTKQKQENNTYEVQEAKKWNLSVEEYRAQMEMLSKGNEDRDTDHKTTVNLHDNKQHDEENLAMGPGDSVRLVLGEDTIRLQREEYERVQREPKRRHSEDIEPQDNVPSAHNKPNEGQDQHASLPSHPDYQNVPRYSGSSHRNPDSSHSSPRSQHHHGNSNQGQVPQHHVSSHSQHQDGNLDEIPPGFAIGTMVQRISRGGDHPIRGVILWIGVVPNYQGYVAGVELDYPIEGCTDGSWNGSQYFKCPPGRALFCPLKSLELDTRYMEPHQVPAARRQELKNPLEDKAPLFDDDDTPGGPELFSQYIGDEHGIQGHHNSCYLDATVFGLFALSDSFDMMLLEEPKHEVGQKIKRILWKGIVNPLRKYGLARHESIMELRNELQKHGRMKGASEDEKDPEEFLNLLFKEILHVDPFLSIKRPFGVEKEYFVQLFFEIDPQQNTIPTTENLILKMFHEQQISFTRVPSKLLLQMPRFGKEFKMYNRIIPSLEIDVKPLLDPSEMMGDTSKFSKMQLLSVICIETSQYVCYTRTTNNRWLFHDSMANRIYDMYNIPKVTEVSRDLQHWVYDEKNHQKLLQAASKDIPEYVRRFTEDIYMCVYVNPDMDRYGTESLPPEFTSQVQSSHPMKQDVQLPPPPNSPYQRSSSNPEDQYYQQQYDDHNRQHNPVISGESIQRPVATPRKVKMTQDEHNPLIPEMSQLQEDNIRLQTEKTEEERKQREANKKAKRREDEMNEAYKNLQETICKEYQKLKTDHQKLQQDHEEMKQESQKLQQDHHTLQQECQKQQHDLNTVRTDHQQLQIVLRQKDRDHQIEKTHLEEQIRKREESWKVSQKDVEMTQEELGRGGWGVIQVGLFREQRVAVKQLYKVIMSKGNLVLMHREINTMSKLRHPNLLLFIGAVLDHPSGNPLIITEIMDASLRDVYERNQLTSEMMKLTILRDVAAGLNYLHCLDDPIIHRDVSSANVLLESKGPDRWKAKLSDFGSANFARNATTKAAGAAVYSPPECVATIVDIVRKKQTTKIDVFSFGVLLCEIMTCRFPDLDQFHGMLQNVATSSPPIAQLIRTCVEKEAENRPTIRTVIQQLDERVRSLTK